LAEQRLALGEVARAADALVFKSSPTDRTEPLRAAILERGGATEQAATIYARLGNDPKNLTASIRGRASAERAVAEGDLRRALFLLENQVKRSPEDLLTRVRLAEITKKSGDAARARQIALEALRVVWEPTLRKRLVAIVQSQTRESLEHRSG